jgi:hypothetical protein
MSNFMTKTMETFILNLGTHLAPSKGQMGHQNQKITKNLKLVKSFRKAHISYVKFYDENDGDLYFDLTLLPGPLIRSNRATKSKNHQKFNFDPKFSESSQILCQIL